MKKLLLLTSLLMLANFASAAANCVGKISSIYKWDHVERLSVIVTAADGTNSPWITMSKKSDEALALMAFAADLPATFYWAADDVTGCGTDAWSHNRVLQGYFLVTKS